MANNYQLPITNKKGEIIAFTLVDKDVYFMLKNQKLWFDHTYVQLWDKETKRKYHLQRYILKTKEGFETDHINQNKLDNRRINLRQVKRIENLWNRKVQNNTTSGYKGITWSRLHKKWRVRISVNKKRINLGLFNNILEAANSYNKAANIYHGEFACLNFVSI